ncbi:MAG: sugar phosphate isomerase/epimerase, partial [Clostridia bacterium]|nr:sugar phosphate isomerase/epimerase [Clostridia bacterium]
MDYGIFSWFGYVLPLKERFSLIRQAGFSAVCTWWADLDLESDGPRQAQRDLAERAGLRLENAHLPYYGCDALWKKGLSGEAFAESYSKDIRLAGEAGIPTLVLHPFELDVPEDGNLSIFLSRLGHLCDVAEAAGVRLAVENLKNWPALIRILDDLWDHPALGFCFDSGHANVVAQGDVSLLERYGKKLFAIHMHD